MIDELKKNIQDEIEILKEISILSKKLKIAVPNEKIFILSSIESLKNEIKSINNSIPKILDDLFIERKTEIKKVENLEIRNQTKNSGRMMPQVKKTDAYLKELEIDEDLLKKIKNKKKSEDEEIYEFKKARGYLKLSNRFFLEAATNVVKKGYFKNLPLELKKANLDILFQTYIAMIFLSTLISFFLASLIFIGLLIYGIGILNIFWIPLVVPIGVFLALIYYPSTEKMSISKKIDEEIPFAVIHMSSISGSGIEPSQIFKIVGLSKDYPYLKKEIMKILNQINLYGYDLVNALNNVSKTTANQRLAELFMGLSTTISSGGNLQEFFNKRADTLLLGYKLEKEGLIKMAETFMDIYISVVIAAPMILMLMLIMISVSGIEIGFTPYQMTFATIGGVALVNIIFLAYLQTREI